MPSSTSSGDRRELVASLVDGRRLLFFALVATAAVLVDVTVVELFGVETASDAVTQFVVVTLGGYLGVTLADALWTASVDR